MDENGPVVLIVVTEEYDALVDVCERCGDELHAGEVWWVKATDGDLHELEWVCCAECFGDLAQTWWDKASRPAGAHHAGDRAVTTPLDAQP